MAAPTALTREWRVAGPRRSAYTLVELLVSASSMGVLMIGIASAVLLATQSLDSGATPSIRLHHASIAMDEFVRDVGSALTIQQDTPSSLTFVVPDRDDDGTDDTLHYAWSGTPGDPITREINGGPASNIIDSVLGLYMSFHLRPGEVVDPEDPNDLAAQETLLVSNEAPSDLSDFSVTPAYWIGEYFKPSLPDDATSWSITKVQFKARIQSAPASVLGVQIRQAGASGLPTSTVLEEVQIPESTLGYDYDPWTEIGFTSVSGLSPTQGVCLVLKLVSGLSAGQVRYQAQGASVSNAYLVMTGNGGSSWSIRSDEALLFKIYGTVRDLSGSSSVNGKLGWIRASIRVGDDIATRLDVAVQLLNTPEMTGQ